MSTPNAASQIASLIPNALEWRCIGPFRGGRAVAVAGDVSNPMAFYFGCAGGVWKTADGGLYWECVSDGYFETSAVGALAVSESDPNVIYAGMGESCVAVPRLHWTSRADGMYRSTDAGRSWTNVGLKTTRHIARIRVHPQDADLVYVAVLGRLGGAGRRKGRVSLQRRRRFLGESPVPLRNRRRLRPLDGPDEPPHPVRGDVGRAPQLLELVQRRPSQPHLPHRRRRRFVDRLTENPGLPRVELGRIGVTGTAAKPGRVWALFDVGGAAGVAALAEIGGRTGGLYRSDDYGETWDQVNADPELTVRPHYYNHIFGDPNNPEVIYNLNQPFFKSIDGGRSFHTIEAPHYDNHDLWIDPNDSNRMINGNDGGACVSFNGGDSWSSIYNQPTGEFYHLTTDAEFPYRVYATQQDNTAISVPSRSSRGAIRWSDCYSVGSSESGHIAVRPDNPNVSFSGALGSSPGAGPIMLRYDRASEQTRVVTIWPDLTGLTVPDRKYRFEWDSPIVFSPHDPNVLYSAANVVFRSVDEGASWQVISPDLTRNDTSDREEFDPNTDIAPFERCAISRFAESPVQAGVFWTGSSDGMVHVSRDGGASWTDVTPPDLPEWSPIYGIDASPHDPRAAYVAAARYQHGDYHPYLFRTADCGATWTRIDSGIPDGDYTRVIREDPQRRGLLYAGSEGGVYVSFDDGDSWTSLRLDMPAVPIHDMTIRDGDLAVATHGRALWILDDLETLRQLAEVESDATLHLFRPRPAYRVLTEPYNYWRQQSGQTKHYQLGLGIPATYRISETENGARSMEPIDAGKNPPNGVVVAYYLDAEPAPADEVALTFTDSDGNVVKRVSSGADAGDDRTPRPTSNAGMNRYVWDMRYEAARPVEGESQAGRAAFVPIIPPGDYRVALQVGDETREATFETLLDPRVSASPEDLRRQRDLLLAIRDKVSEASDAVTTARRVMGEVERWAERSADIPGGELVAQSAESLRSKLSAIEDELTLGTGGADTPMRGAFYARGLRSRLAALGDTAGMADAAPTQQSQDVYDHLASRIDAQLNALTAVLQNDLQAFNAIVRELDLPPLTP